jgi:membrane-associated protease RseP (regulator of RpoE activity)
MTIFGIPVKFEFSFFLIALLLARSRISEPVFLIEWVVVVVVSILVHEFGHALTGRAFGLSPQIQLYGMGGLTSWVEAKELSPKKDILVSLAGPLAGFLFGGVVLLAGVLFPGIQEPRFNYIVFTDLLWVNFGWGIFNLLPIFPLDGGHVVRDLELWLLRTSGIITFIVSFLVSAGLVILALWAGEVWIAILMGWFALINAGTLYSLLKSRREQPGVSHNEQLNE